MTKIQTLLEKYSVADYVAWAVGAVLAIYTLVKYIKESWGNLYDHHWQHLGAMAVAIVLMYVPTLFVNLFKRAAKIE